MARNKKLSAKVDMLQETVTQLKDVTDRYERMTESALQLLFHYEELIFSDRMWINSESTTSARSGNGL